MIHTPDQQLDRIRTQLPTMQEVAAHVLLFSVVWGLLGLIILECLP